jgi:sugar phosphate isomerase/epimerase
MQFLFSTGSLWSYSIERCFDLALQAGYDGLELLIDARWESRQIEYLLGLVQHYGLPIHAVHSPFIPNTPGWPLDPPGRLRKSIELAQELESSVVVHHLPARFGALWVQSPGRLFYVPVPRKHEAGYRRWLESDYADFREKIQVKLCIENMPAFRKFGRRWNFWHWNTPDQICRFESITLDTTHLGTWGLDPIAVYEQLDGRVTHIHLINFDGREHLRPESGNLQLDRFMKRVSADGYIGAITLELHPEALDAGEADQVIVGNMARSLQICRRWTRRDTSR